MKNVSTHLYNAVPVQQKSNKQNTDAEKTSKYSEQQSQDTDLNKSPASIYNRVQCSKIKSINGNSGDKRTSYQKNVDCIIGGALGDALGRPVERLRSEQLFQYYGKDGIRDLPTVGLKARVTDDTQMTMFTADGLIKSALKKGKDTIPDYKLVFNSYKDWYNTQTKDLKDCTPHGWLSEVQELYSPVGPGKTCLSALKAGIPGSVKNPINESGGCGGVMRVAPAGLMYDDPRTAFEVGAECCALTHGHPNAYLPSGFHSAVVSNIKNGKSLEEAFNNSLEILKTYDNHEDTYNLITKAIELAKSDVPSDKAIEKLGHGFLGHEAMAIATYAIFKEPTDLKEALCLAVNHTGDSDSTGAITGNILGLAIGTDTIPPEWIESLEMTDEMKTLAKDMADVEHITDASRRYPVKS